MNQIGTTNVSTNICQLRFSDVLITAHITMDAEHKWTLEVELEEVKKEVKMQKQELVEVKLQLEQIPDTGGIVRARC